MSFACAATDRQRSTVAIRDSNNRGLMPGPLRCGTITPISSVGSRPMRLRGQQKTRAASPAGGLALAAFVKRPQADAQIGAGEDHTEADQFRQHGEIFPGLDLP